MRGLFPSLIAALAALVSCSADAARTGIIGNTLTTNVKPYVAVTADSSFTLLGGGRLPLAARTDIMTDEASVAFHYALFAADAGSGPERRFAYAAIARLEEARAWRFQPGIVAAPGTFSENVPGPGPAFAEGEWYGILLRVMPENDWPSDVLRENGQPLPVSWLAARWVTNLNNEARVVIEYREPWPERYGQRALGDPSLFSDDARAYFDAFAARAKASFTVTRDRGDFKAAGVTPAPSPALPRTRPDVARLVGEVVSAGNDG